MYLVSIKIQLDKPVNILASIFIINKALLKPPFGGLFACINNIYKKIEIISLILSTKAYILIEDVIGQALCKNI